MSWACRHCQELGPLEQLGIVVSTSTTKETHSASCVAATVNILAHQVQLSACKDMVQSAPRTSYRGAGNLNACPIRTRHR